MIGSLQFWLLICGVDNCQSSVFVHRFRFTTNDATKHVRQPTDFFDFLLEINNVLRFRAYLSINFEGFIYNLSWCILLIMFMEIPMWFSSLSQSKFKLNAVSWRIKISSQWIWWFFETIKTLLWLYEWWRRRRLHNFLRCFAINAANESAYQRHADKGGSNCTKKSN